MKARRPRTSRTRPPASPSASGSPGALRLSRGTRRVTKALPPGAMPRCADALHAWLAEHLDVHTPRVALLESSTAPFAYLCHAFFEGRAAAPAVTGTEPASPALGSPDCVVWANRGGGKTFLGAVATLLDLCWKPEIEVRILGGSLEQSRRMYEHLRGFFDRAAFRRLIDGRITRREIKLVNGSRVQILAQSEAAVRGTRVQKLRCDEVDIFDPEVWRAAQLTTRSIQCASPWGGWVRGSVEALSTMHRPLGLMWEIVGDARRPCQGRDDMIHAPSARDGDAPPDDAAAPPARRRAGPMHAPRALFRWGIVDTLESCPRERACEQCVLHPECEGRAKERPPARAGHVTIDDAVSQKARVSRASWESEMLCLRPFRGHAVFPEFDPAVHVFSPSPEEAETALAIADAARGLTAPTSYPHGDPLSPLAVGVTPARSTSPLFCGMDFGFRAPTVILWARLSADGVLRVIAERSAVQTRLEDHVDAILSCPLGLPAWVGIDPAGGQRDLQTALSCADVLRKAGLVVHGRRLSVHEGLNLIRARLAPAIMRPRAVAAVPSDATQEPGPMAAPGRVLGTIDFAAAPTLYVSARCPKLIEALTKYHYDEQRPESIDPVKDGSDHAVDALRYLLVALDRAHSARRAGY